MQWDDLDLVNRTVLIRETKLSKERVAHYRPPGRGACQPEVDR